MKLGLNPTLALLAAFFGGLSHASPIYIDSRAGLNSIANTPNGPVDYSTVAIGVHPQWQPNSPTNPGDENDTAAVWISYAQTGYVGADFQAYGGEKPVLSVFHDFSSAAGTLTLNVWADDTAAVFLDNIEIAYPKFTQSICAGQAIGCLPGDMGRITAALTAGDHVLEFRLFQVGVGINSQDNPFGLLYTGTASSDGGFHPDTPPDPPLDTPPNGPPDTPPNGPPDTPPNTPPGNPPDNPLNPNTPSTTTPEPGTIGLAGLALLAALPLKKRILAKRVSR